MNVPVDTSFNTQAAVPAWRFALPLVAVSLLILFALYNETTASLVSTWLRSDTYAHGMLIGPISLYMVWIHRRSLRRLTPAPALLGVATMLVLVVLWFLGNTASVLVVQQFSLVLMIPALIWILLGWTVVRALAFPLAYLLFAVPVGEFLVLPLQELTATFTVQAIRLTGIPIYREGLYFTIPSGNFEVAKACSGIRYLIASIALGCLYAYITYRSYWRRAVFIALSVLVPLIANGLRAYGIVMIAHLSDMRLAVGLDHLIYGWLFFGVVIFLLFWLGLRWRDMPVGDVVDNNNVAPLTVLPLGHRRFVVTALAALLVMAAGPGLAAWSQAKTLTARDGDIRFAAPRASGEWTGPLSESPDWRPVFQQPDAEMLAVYADADAEQKAMLYLAYYVTERQNAELINSQNQLYDKTAWTRVSRSATRLTLLNGRTLEVNQIVLRSATRQRRIWYWYDIAGHATATPAVGKLYQGIGRLLGWQPGGSVIAVAMDGEGEASEQIGIVALRNFVQTMLTPVETALAQTLDNANASDSNVGSGARQDEAGR
jgi:exosortase A